MSVTEKVLATVELPSTQPLDEPANTFAVESGKEPLTLRMQGIFRLTEKQLRELSRQNDLYRFERTAEGELEIMSPVVWNGGSRNLELSGQLRDWARRDGSGRGADSSAGYILSSGAMRSPDTSWILRSRLATVPTTQQDSYLPLAPDFAAELRSPSDRPRTLRRKMEEYIANGVRLGILLDPIARTVMIYRPGVSPITLDNPATVDCSPELPGFVLDVQAIFDPS